MRTLMQWLKDEKKKFFLEYNIRHRNLSYKVLEDFINLLSINLLSDNDAVIEDSECFRIVEVNSAHKKIKIGDSELKIDIDMITDSGKIYLNILYNKMSGQVRKGINYTACFDGKISKDRLLDSISFYGEENEVWIDISIDLICSCMLRTIRYYITRWL